MNEFGLFEYSARIGRQPQPRAASILLLRYDGRNTDKAKSIELEWERIEPYHYIHTPTLIVEPNLIKALANALVDGHELPRDFLSNDAQTTAIKDHLKDMKEVNTKLFGIIDKGII